MSDFGVEHIKDKTADIGITETIIPLLYGFCFAAFSNDFELCIPISFLLLYSKFYDITNEKWRLFVLLSVCVGLFYISYYKCLIMTLMTYLPFELLLNEYARSFEFAELFTLLHLNSTFVIFWLEKWVEFTCIFKLPEDSFSSRIEYLEYIKPQTPAYIPEILLYFSPYIILNIAAVMFFCSMYVSKRNPKILTLPICLVLSCLIMLGIVFGSNAISPFKFDVFHFIFSQFMNVVTNPMFWYILMSLVLWIFLINILKNRGELIAVRKLYHFAALFSFLPVVLISPKMLTFAANVFITLFVIVEFSKKYAMKAGNILYLIHKYEHEYLDEKEKNKDNLILSHLFLLLGCCVPTVSSYIMLNGAEFTPHFIYLSLSGLIFVGIGDSMAALGGTLYGKTKWPERSKTQEGSIIGLFFHCVFYIILLIVTMPGYISGKGIEIFFVGLLTILVEAFTRCFDNFLCPQFCYALTVMLNYYFEVFITNYSKR